MSELSISLNLSSPISHLHLVGQICPAFALAKGDALVLEINLPQSTGFLYSDNLLVITSLVDHLRSNGTTVDIKINGSSTYAARVNFYQLLGIPFDEENGRKNSMGRFIELKPFNSESMYNLQEELNMILLQIEGISMEVLQLLFYCLGEIIDNTIVHSGLNKGWVSAQFFPKSQEIRLIICDNGMGIQRSLSANEKYSDLSEAEAIKSSIQRGVTDGAGLGFGLFATSQFILRNQGDLLLYSGNHYLYNDKDEYKIKEAHQWQGTMVYLRINTNVKVDYKEIMGNDHTLPDDYQFFVDKYFGDEDELW